MSIEKQPESIISLFETLEDWMDKYEYLISIANEKNPISTVFKMKKTSLQAVNLWFGSAPLVTLIRSGMP